MIWFVGFWAAGWLAGVATVFWWLQIEDKARDIPKTNHTGLRQDSQTDNSNPLTWPEHRR